MNKPLISVIIPAYNVAPLVTKALDSVTKQTYPNIEIIVVDDGSSDHTYEVVRAHTPEALIIRQENRGLAGARNTGIRASKGEYLAFLDADDLWLPHKLEKQYGFAMRHPEVSFFVCNVINLEGGRRGGLRYSSKRIFGETRSEGIVTNYIRPMSRYCFHAPSSWFVRRGIFDKYGLFDESLRTSEDSDMVLRWVLAGENIGYQDEGMVLYQTANPDSLRKDLAAWSDNHFRCWFKGEHYGIPSDKVHAFATMRRLSLLDSCFTLILSGSGDLARRHLTTNKAVLFSTRWCWLLFLSFLPFRFVSIYNAIRGFIRGTGIYKYYKGKRY